MPIDAAVDGQGVALGSTNLVADDLAAGRLVRPFALSLEGAAPFAYYLVTRRLATDRPLVEAFRSWILDACRETGSGT